MVSASRKSCMASEKVIPIVVQPLRKDKAAVSAPANHEQATPQGTESVAPAPSTERERLIAALEQSGWVQAKAARLLDISPRQMGYALLKYNIEVKKF